MRLAPVMTAMLISILALQAALPEEATPAESEGGAAEESDWWYGGGLAFMSKYVSRGVVISDDPVLQPELHIGYGNASLSLWNNVDLTDYEVAPWRVTETDWTVDYTFETEAAEYSAGYVYYTFPNLHIDDTQEVYGCVEFDVPLSPAATCYWDFDELGGIYAAASVCQPVPLGIEAGGEELSLEWLASIGWGDDKYNGGCFGDEASGWVDFVVGFEVPVNVGEAVVVTGSLAYMTVLDEDLRACTEKSEALYGGVAACVEF